MARLTIVSSIYYETDDGMDSTEFGKSQCTVLPGNAQPYKRVLKVRAGVPMPVDFGWASDPEYLHLFHQPPSQETNPTELEIEQGKIPVFLKVYGHNLLKIRQGEAVGFSPIPSTSYTLTCELDCRVVLTCIPSRENLE